MGAVVPFIPLIAAVAPMAMSAMGVGPKAPKAPKPQAAPTQRDVHQAAAPPKTPTLADASIERARRAAGGTNIRSETLRTKPQGLLDDAETTTGGSLL